MTAALNQLWQDMAPDMVFRDRRLRVTELTDTHALCVVEHDHAGLTGRTARIRLNRLKAPGYRLVEDAGNGDALYAAILAAVTKVHRPDTTHDAWGLKCTCKARNRFATWHNSACDLFQKFPAHGRSTAAVRTTEQP